MLEETLYADNFWGFDEPMRNRAAVFSMYKQRLLKTIQTRPLNDRVIFLTTAEMLNTILLPIFFIYKYLVKIKKVVTCKKNCYEIYTDKLFTIKH